MWQKESVRVGRDYIMLMEEMYGKTRIAMIGHEMTYNA